MKELSLNVVKRDATGKGANRRLREQGFIPAVVYGPETKPILVQINYRDLYKAMHGVSLSAIIDLTIEGTGEPTRKVLIRELQKDPVSGDLVHLDFHHIAMDKPITVTIPIHTEGIPDGVKNFGGIVQMVRRELEISCLPANIPDQVVIDISHLGIGGSVHVSEITLENIEIVTDPGQTIVTVVAPTIIKEAVAEAEAVPTEGAVEGEAEKAEGEGEEKEGPEEGKREGKREAKKEAKKEGKKEKEG